MYKNDECFKILFYEKDDQYGATNIVNAYYFRSSDYFPKGYEKSLSIDDKIIRESFHLKNIISDQTFDEKKFNINSHIINDDKNKYYVEENEAPMTLGQKAPVINKQLTNGKYFNLNRKKDKVIVLDFWFMSCIPCVKALPIIQKISNAYNLKEVEVIGVNPYNSKDKINSFYNKKGYSLVSTFDSKEVVKNYKVTQFPTIYVINKNGEIVKSYIGENDALYEEITEVIDSLIK